MPARFNKTLAIEQRRNQIAELYVQGWTQEAIAERVQRSQPVVCQDLKAIRQEWRESVIRDFDTARDKELARLDKIERTAWKAWELSKVDSPGDPRFLAVVGQSIAQRRKLLGLDRPPGEVNREMPDNLSPEQRREQFEFILDALSVRAQVSE